ncbi:RidA family protein [Variovorax sp. LjRoot84]|uniref:RidA family protein n=1 Tax=unclassified Variovorax TaxID=663243 RepID=UPI00087EFCBC|nr:RidA family protein [Variovorax sp. CF079]SDE62578.1 Enamine deaminase RidA, house cleaning of reactive enamine intermediates, YjgF/YER057c/UK114 family [Variovorax sp. CF079]
MSDIQRYDSNARLSRIVVHNSVVYVAGVTATDRSGDAQAQTADILAKIDGYLASVGTNKSRLLSVQIWLQDIERDFTGLNAAWAAWIPADAMPTRATCEAKLAAPDLRVEIIVTAAL